MWKQTQVEYKISYDLMNKPIGKTWKMGLGEKYEEKERWVWDI